MNSGRKLSYTFSKGFLLPFICEAGYLSWLQWRKSAWTLIVEKAESQKQKLVFWKSGVLMRKHMEEIAVNDKSYLGFISRVLTSLACFTPDGK